MSDEETCKNKKNCIYKEECESRSIDVPISYGNYFIRQWSNKYSRSRVGVICTIGPSVFTSEEDHKINELIKNGMNIARINISHFRLIESTDETLKPLEEDLNKIVEIIKTIRRCSKGLRIPVNIMLDLKGPKICVSFFTVPDLKKLIPLKVLEIKEGFRFTMVSYKHTKPITVKKYVLVLKMDENELINTFKVGSEYFLKLDEGVGGIARFEKKNSDNSLEFVIKEIHLKKDRPNKEEEHVILKGQTEIEIIKDKDKKVDEISPKIDWIYEPVMRIEENDKLILADKKILDDEEIREHFLKKNFPVIFLDYDGNFVEDIAVHSLEDPIYLDDGKASFRLTPKKNPECSEGKYNCPTVEVIYGEKVELMKRMNLFNNTRKTAEFISDIDRIYLNEILTHPAFVDSCPIDSIAVSSVRSSSDLNKIDTMLKMFCDKKKNEWNIKNIKLVAKIETPHCFMKRYVYNQDRFDQRRIDFMEYREILNNKLCWAVMVERGNLGIEIEAEMVPEIQRNLTEPANIAGKSVIVATHLLLSMVNNIRPSRADVTDIHNAVLSGADVVMLSEETAIGKYPIKALKFMRTIIDKAVNDLMIPEKRSIYLNKILKAEVERRADQIMELLGESMVNTSLRSGSPVLFLYTMTGETVTKITKYRSDKPIIAITNSEMAAKNMLFYFGVFPFLVVKKEENKDKADFDFPRDMKEYREFIRAIVNTFRNKEDKNYIYFESLKDITDGQIVFGLLGIDDKASYLSDQAIAVFRL